MHMYKKIKIFICTRHYAIEAKSEEEAKQIMQDTENDIDLLTDEEWEEASSIHN